MYAPPPPTNAGGQVVNDRRGWVFGMSLGAGSMSGNEGESKEGVAFDMHVGFMVSPQLALLIEGYGVSHLENDVSLTQTMGLIAGQLWLNPALWIKGGLGSGSLIADNGVRTEESQEGVAVMAAAGYEILHSNRFAVDAQVRVGAVSYDNGYTVTQTALSVGVNWY